MRAPIVALLLILVVAALAPGRAAAASSPAGCALPGYVSGTRAAPCPAGVTADPSGESLLGSAAGGLFGSLLGGTVNIVFRGFAGAALDSAAAALRITGSLVSVTTQPALGSSWFSAAYWRVAAVSLLLTLPFLFAAAVHGLVRSDLALVARAAFGYLPLGLLGVAIAAPLTTLVLSATDEVSAFVGTAAGTGDSSFLARAASGLTTPSLVHGDLFLAFIVAMLTVVAAIGLWIELLIRGAAVDVVVLMLPLFFAAMVWPARRVWAVRAVETLVALILSKFAIVAVLALGGAALSHLDAGPVALLTGATLIMLAALSPWVLLRLLPLHEVAAAAAGGLSQTPRRLAAQAVNEARSHGRGQPSRDGTPAPTPRTPRSATAAAADSAMALQRIVGHGGGARRSPADDADFSRPTRDGLWAVDNLGRRASPGASSPASAPAAATLAAGRDQPADWQPSTEPVVLGEEGEDRMGSMRHLIEPVPGPADGGPGAGETAGPRDPGDVPTTGPPVINPSATNSPAIDPPGAEPPPPQLPPATGTRDPLGPVPPPAAGDERKE